MFTTMLDAGTPATLASMIRRAFGSCAAKKAAPYADVSDRTVSDWLQRRAEPGAWKLLRMVRHPQFRAELRAYLDHIEMEEANIASRMDEITAQRLRNRDSDICTPRVPLRPASLRSAAKESSSARVAVKA